MRVSGYIVLEEKAMQTRNSIIREYANGMADAFLNDLVIAEERYQGSIINSENALIDAFRNYVYDTKTLFSR